MRNIGNFFQFSDKLLTGAQPSAEAIESLKQDGVDVLINLSPSSTPNYLNNEAEIAEKQNLTYFHLPIDCSNLQKHHFESVKAILDVVSDKKVFIHCGGNIKSSNIVHMYSVISGLEEEQESFQKLSKVQNPEEKWDRYFKGFGMKGFLN